jgi:alkylation response protein AidB-like acyl-CoA dehydrogenase
MTEPTTRPLLKRPDPTAEQEEWLAQVEKIVPVLEAYRDQAERERDTPKPVFDAIREAGLTRLWIAREFGGHGVSIETGSAVIQAVAQVDASVSWQLGVQAAIGHLSDYLPEDTAAEIFKTSAGAVAGGINPSGRAVQVPGGYRVTGEWGFGSGASNAEWVAVASLLTEDGKVVFGPDGYELRMCFVPQSALEIQDTWYTMGLRGTGSNDFRISDLFVPEEFAVKRSDMLRVPSPRPSRVYPVSYYDFGPFSPASSALGIAQKAVATIKDVVCAKKTITKPGTLANSQAVQEKIGRAEMHVLTAEVLLAHAAREAVTTGDAADDSSSALIRLAGAAIAENCISAVDIAFTLAGTGSIFSSSPLDRCLRDVRSVTKHISVAPANIESVGEYLLGGTLEWRR